MQYIKNVTNKVELGKTAYLDCEGVFCLGFNHTPKAPKFGDTIALCQKVDGERCFTHLVVVIDCQIHTHENVSNYKHYFYVQIIAKGIFPIKNTTYWKDIPHGGYARGKLVNISKIGKVKQDMSLVAKLREEVWRLFFPSPKSNFIEVFNVHRHGFINRP